MIGERADFRSLAGEIAGEIILPGDAGYEAGRRVWNGMIDKRPLGIVRCSGSGDVLAAIAFARAYGIVVAVRGGSHTIAGNATCADGLVIDRSPMKSIDVEQTRRRVRADGGVDWGALEASTQSVRRARHG